MGQNGRNAKKNSCNCTGSNIWETKRKFRRNEEVQESIKEKKEAKKAWDKIRDKNTKKIYKKKKSKAKKAVAMAKGRAYDNLYKRLETKEGEKELYRLARQRDRAGKDVQHMRVIKDENGNVMVNSEAVLKR